MAPRNKRPKAGLRRIDAALDAMRPLGFADQLVRKSVNDLLKVYGNEGWPFIEDGAYRELIELMLNTVNEQKGSDDHEHDLEGKSVHESCDLLAETSEAGQCGKIACEYHEGDESTNELVVAEKQVENQGKDNVDQTLTVEISSVATDDTQPCENQGRVFFGFVPTPSLPPTDSASSTRKCKLPCYGWISDDDEEEDEEDSNAGNTNTTQ